MSSNLIPKEKVHTHVTEIIIRGIISKIPELVEKKKTYEKLKDVYDNLNATYDHLTQQFKSWYPREYQKYKGFAFPNPDLPKGLNRLLLKRRINKYQAEEEYRKMCAAKKEYDAAFNLINSYFNKYKESELKYIMDYLDIEINSSEIEIKDGTLILESIIRDFEILDLYQLQLPPDKPYRGTISLVETLLNQIKECEIKIEKYNEYEKKLEFLSDEYEDKYKLIKDKENRKDKIESIFINKLLKRDELGDLKFDLKSLYMTLQNIITEFDLCVNAANILLNEKSEMCLKCIKNKPCIDIILDRLGEKSLRELINKLNIVIPKSEDNYFNEKEEMKKLIKKYFEEFQDKINNEINNEKELEENNHWSKIDVMTIISYMQKDEKVLIKK